MSLRLTRKSIETLFRLWPQAVSADIGDFRVLHDLANLGAQSWGESLNWPDCIWLGLEPDLGNQQLGPISSRDVVVTAPDGSGLPAALGVLNQVASDRLPNTGNYAIGKVECILEVKAIQSDLAKKLARFTAETPWPHFLRKKLDRTFRKHLEHANKQVRDGKRILGFSAAKGVAIILNEGAPSLNRDMVCAYLAKAIVSLEHIDGVVYLAETGERPSPIAIVTKVPHDKALRKFHQEFLMMLSAFDWKASTPSPRGFAPLNLVAQITTDEHSYQMYKTWATGWRVVDDPRPVPSPSLTVSFVPEGDYKPGLKRTGRVKNA